MSDFEIHSLCKKYPALQQYVLDDEKLYDACKVQRLLQVLPDMIARGDKILIFSQFVIMLNILAAVLDSKKIAFLRLDGQTEVSERQNMIDIFQEDDAIPVFLLSTKAGGVGLNLMAANVVILYDLDFNPHNDVQAENRAHRVGQKRDVKVIRFVVKDSIEEKILEIGMSKLALDEKIKNGVALSEEEASGAVESDLLKYISRGNLKT